MAEFKIMPLNFITFLSSFLSTQQLCRNVQLDIRALLKSRLACHTFYTDTFFNQNSYWPSRDIEMGPTCTS